MSVTAPETPSTSSESNPTTEVTEASKIESPVAPEASDTDVEIPVRPRLTLRDAVRLSGMSEKTLRRKLEAGLLQGTRETLDYGGFMWMIETKSLADLYPDSAQLRDYIQLLESQLPDLVAEQANVPAPVATSPATNPSAAPRAGVPASNGAPTNTQSGVYNSASAAASTPPKTEESASESKESGSSDFVLYLLEENRCLKEDIREKEVRLRNLQERTMHLERECGEQRGTAATQARVLEWFQQQPQPALPAGPGDAALSSQVVTEVDGSGKTWTPQRLALVGALSASLLIWLCLWLVRIAAS